MLYASYVINDCVSRINNIAKTTRGTVEIDKLKGRIATIYHDLRFALEEFFFLSGHNKFADCKMIVSTSLNTIANTEDVKEIIDSLETVVNAVGVLDHLKYTFYSLNTSKAHAAMSNLNISQHNMNAIAQCIIPQRREINIFDPKCNNGNNLMRFADGLKAADFVEEHLSLYGAESYVSKSSLQSPAMFKKLAMGTLNGSRISNDAFDIMLTNLPITVEHGAGTLFPSSRKGEKLAAQSTYKYVRPGGVIIYFMPYFRLYRDMCLYFARYLDNVQVTRLYGDEFDSAGLIAIIGNKSNRKEPDEEIFKMLRRCHDLQKIPSLFIEPLNKMTMPNGFVAVDVFRGSVLDMEEIEGIAEKSGCYDAFWKSQSVEKLQDSNKKPLLPFNIGQIGLVLASGALDGIVKEKNNCAHLIKGRVSKQTETSREVIDNRIEVNETINNRVEINIFLPNGDYKVLA